MTEKNSGDKKQRPEFGEYATPQDQAAAMGKSYGGTGLSEPAPADTHQEKQKPAKRSAAPVPATESTSADSGKRAPRTWDAVLTVVLLAIGVGAVLISMPQFADLYDLLNTASAQVGGGQYTSRELAENVGLGLNLGLIAILVLTVVASVRALRAGRLAFYLPILGGVLGVILMFVMIAVATAGDSAFMDSIPTS